MAPSAEDLNHLTTANNNAGRFATGIAYGRLQQHRLSGSGRGGYFPCPQCPCICDGKPASCTPVRPVENSPTSRSTESDVPDPYIVTPLEAVVLNQTGLPPFAICRKALNLQIEMAFFFAAGAGKFLLLATIEFFCLAADDPPAGFNFSIIYDP